MYSRDGMSTSCLDTYYLFKIDSTDREHTKREKNTHNNTAELRSELGTTMIQT